MNSSPLAKWIRSRSKTVKGLVGIGVFLIVAGTCIDVITTTWYRSRTWYPIDMQVPVTIGHFRTPEFTPNVDNRFEVALEVDRVLSQEAEVALGTGDELGRNASGTRGFRLEWTVLSRGQIVGHGVSDGLNQGYWSRKRGRILGLFDARKGQPYQVEFQVIDDATALQAYHPRALVQVDLWDLDGYAMSTGILALGGDLLAGLGGVILLTGVLIGWWQLRRRATMQHNLAQNS